jgi:hypothetical protein
MFAVTLYEFSVLYFILVIRLVFPDFDRAVVCFGNKESGKRCGLYPLKDSVLVKKVQGIPGNKT